MCSLVDFPAPSAAEACQARERAIAVAPALLTIRRRLSQMNPFTATGPGAPGVEEFVAGATADVLQAEVHFPAAKSIYMVTHIVQQ